MKWIGQVLQSYRQHFHVKDEGLPDDADDHDEANDVAGQKDPCLPAFAGGKNYLSHLIRRKSPVNKDHLA
jgi:hypothetical protein